MHDKIVLAFLLQCTLCLTIRVPVDWNDDSEVKEQFGNAQNGQVPIYNEYFQYNVKKPQFAIDIATTHGIQSPEKYYTAHPVIPQTRVAKPVLGQHQIINPDKTVYQPFQHYIQNSGSHVSPVKTAYEVFHPYIAEVPALEAIYKDPVLGKIRNDLRDSKNRLQKYENEAGETDVRKEEYLESPEETDRRKIPQKNIPVQYEVHRPERRPVYYHLPARTNNRERILNQKLRHPWNQIVKVTPNHYIPVKNHLQRLRQQHALKYDDERNEYPQIPVAERNEDKPDGYDIYIKGKEKYLKLRNNLDDSITKLVLQQKPNTNVNLELQKERVQDNSKETSDEEEFVPIKNYAQVRKTETTKHLPRTAALRDAENYEEIQNAPHLREAIKSSKAQVVYSEEGYEDAAYDHAGEQKQASDHEKHGGYLKENEISNGKYKKPSKSSSYKDAKGSAYRDQLIHGKKWKDDKREKQEESETDDYSEDDEEHDLNSDVIADEYDTDNDSDRNKRNSEIVLSEDSSNLNKSAITENQRQAGTKSNAKDHQQQHDVIKRDTTFKIPTFDFNSTLPSDDDILKLSKTKAKSQKMKENTKHNKKYPYYTKNITALNKNSPLRYAENFKLIPKKSSGGTEFYDSRSKYECPEVESEVDPIPEKLKKGGHPDENEDITDENKFNNLKNKQRLRGLGDKIDCFKTKYFGENPLDSPFFKEGVIENPEPITKPNLEIFKTKQPTNNLNNKILSSNSDIFVFLKKINDNHKQPDTSLMKNNYSINDILLKSQSNGSKNVSSTINKDLQENLNNGLNSNTTINQSNTNDKTYENKEIIQTVGVSKRKKRATGFMYEPYKIIRDSQVQDSKKTTTSSNISPLIKQLQSSRVIDKVTSNTDKDSALKKNTKNYKDIGKTDRQKLLNEEINDPKNSSFVNVSPDMRGEPRYELRPANHKDTYSPVTIKRAISLEDYKTQINGSNTETSKKPIISKITQQKRSNSPTTSSRLFFDVSKYLPQLESQKIAASNAVRKVIRTSPDITTEKNLHRKYSKKDEEYDEYGDKDEEDKEEIEIVTTTTTTEKSVKKRTRGTTTTTTTTVKPIVVENESESPKLYLTTRFRPLPTEESKARHKVSEEPHEKEYDHENSSPKYSEKKRKSTKSTLVTDTKTYGDDDDDDNTKKEVDSLLNVKQDMNEYIPHYEKDRYNKNKNIHSRKSYLDDDDDENDDDNDEEDEYSNNDEDDDDDENNNDDDDDSGNIDKEDHITDKDNEDEEDEEEEEEVESHDDENFKHLKVTTSEPTKRTLVRTTIAPPTTTESRSARLELKPMVMKKQIKIHEESPMDLSSPHVTQFKQNIKEIEIIKELSPKPKRKKNRNNLQALQLYKDENLAEEINNLGDVEVFRENLDLDSEPKHGGNYRSITPEELRIEKEMESAKLRDVKNKDDAEVSETKVEKVGVEDGLTDSKLLTTNNNARSAKYTELSDSAGIISKSMHGGNLKFSRNKGGRNNHKSEKLIEFDDDDDDDTSSMHGGNFKTSGQRNSGRPMHGGNYKSAKIIKAEVTQKPPKTRGRGSTRDARTNAAVVLDSFARAVPVLTTAPPFILDPSKRMYYYVD